ncbi:MAG TPA: radical SAM protein [Candidatus Eisenbacteria bacterium]|nr:radical SAM protein [Candidatus Eisenbacteria bacterium]
MAVVSPHAHIHAEPGVDPHAPKGTNLVVNEIYASIQGESTYAGLPCVFVRLTACNLRCSWCDSEFSFYEGTRRTVDEIVAEVECFGLPLVEVTGGEPLLQPGVHPLMTRLADRGYRVLLETSGSLDISPVDPRVIRIVDVKCPASGESARNRWQNMEQLRPTDELKFVIADRADYEWARGEVRARELAKRCTVLFGPVWNRVEPQQLAAWILEDKLPVRFQIQLHKYVWAPDARGV